MDEGAAERLDRGILIISIDTELAWGGFDRPYRERRWSLEQRTREIVGRLLGLFARYQVAATWAVVGHLFLSECKRDRDGRAHADLPRPRYEWFPDDWYRYDPGTSAALDPLWYAPDLLEQLRTADPVQEIGSHSFAHILFGEPGCSVECADADLNACVRAAREWGIELRSLVFPRNKVGHLPLLEKHGFSSFRGADPAWFARLPRPLKRVGHFLDDLLAIEPPTVLPSRRGELYNIPGSMMLQGMDGLRRLISARSRVLKCRRGLNRAVQHRRIFHLWFHPVNFAVGMEPMLAVLEKVLKMAAQARDAGLLDIMPMGKLADKLRESQTISATSH